MQVAKFQKVSRLLAILLKIMASFFIAIIFLGWFAIYFKNPGAQFSIDTNSGATIFYSIESRITDAEYARTAFILVPITFVFFAYLFFKAGSLFEDLADGNSPFRSYFSKAVRKIGFLMIAYDLFFPLIYSALISLISEEGKLFYLSLSSYFLIGLILYVASGILNYGIQLQELADETI